MSVNLAAIAEKAGGTLLGDPEFLVRGVSSIVNAREDSLTFLSDPRIKISKNNPPPGAVLLKPEHQALFEGNRILVADPYLAYARVSSMFLPENNLLPEEVHPSAVIDPTAVLGDRVRIGAGTIIGAHCLIGDDVVLGYRCVIEPFCHIGNHTHLESSVTLCANTRLGSRCVVSPGAVIGASGFGYAPDGRKWQKIQQLGGVMIGDDVDIGANTTIDRGAIDDTVIGNRVKLDNQIQIAHNVRVGDDTIMAGCVAIAGSAVIGERCQLGGRASVLGHLEIADDVVLNANAFVAQSIDQPGVYSSMIPARPIKQWRKTVAHLNRLEKLVERIKNTGK